jgi:hypothetical protein
MPPAGKYITLEEEFKLTGIKAGRPVQGWGAVH